MVDGIRGHRREVRRCAARPQSSTAIGPRALTMIVVVVGLALAAVSAASGQPQRSSAQPQWIVFTARPPGLGAEQIFRIKPSGTGLKQLTRGTYPVGSPGVLARRKADRLRTTGSRNLQHEPRWDGPPPPDQQRPRQLPRLVSGRQADRVHPALRERVEGLRHVGVRRGGAAAPPGASSRPAVLDEPRARDSDRGRPRQDRSSIRACPERFGAIIDASVGMNATAVSPDLSTITFVGAATAGSRGQGLRRGRPLSAVRALHPGSSQAQGAANSRPRRRTGVVLARREEPGVRGSESDRPLALANGTSRSIKTGKVSPTTASPPVWQPR